METSGIAERLAWSRAPERRVTADSCLAALRAGAPIAARAVAVVAHPDDETASLGARLPLFSDLTLIHSTDGAPADGADARRAGFADPQAYAAARAQELDAALAALGIRPCRLALDLQDQTAALHLAELARVLADALRGADLVLTHPYEGGHPDHDACAFALQCACDLLGAEAAVRPVRLEFAGYHKAAGGRAVGRFWPDEARPAVQALMSADQLRHKQVALAAHRSQAEVLAWFDARIEMYREAPTYDFTRPPPPGAALYDDWGLSISSAGWRARARAALTELELEGAA